jgi:transposase
MVGFAMANLSGTDRSQMLLLPEAVDDYVGAENPARFIEAFVDGLDLQAAGFNCVTPKATGRPGYDPADLLKLYIHGYLNSVKAGIAAYVPNSRSLRKRRLLPQGSV